MGSNVNKINDSLVSLVGLESKKSNSKSIRVFGSNDGISGRVVVSGDQTVYINFEKDKGSIGSGLCLVGGDLSGPTIDLYVDLGDFEPFYRIGKIACGFFDPYTMVVYPGGMFVYVDDNIVGYTEGLCDIFKKSTENGLIKLKGHDDIIRMLKELAGDRKVTILFKHFCGVNKRKAPSERSNVSIKEEEVLAKQGRVAAGSKGLGEQEGVEEIEATIHTKNVLYEDAWSSDSDSSTYFDDDFEEPEYMEIVKDEEVEINGVIFDEPNANIEE
ncbi:hypothetical protein LWI28_020734 [Acer negundo]|uniref:Uncharacterized protein n=1 Tax=Acer negundo TaxID=4023 RepID=A0AAD5JUF6_ACENE|nr:hypothetical protein LWI28_020734 [Acer negundo]